MPVSNDNFYKPEEALHELQVQETILKTAIDVQVVLRILVDKEIVTREEVQKYREEVSNNVLISGYAICIISLVVFYLA